MTDYLNPDKLYPDDISRRIDTPPGFDSVRTPVKNQPGGAGMKLLEANGRLAIHLTVDEINSIIKTHLLNQGYASESEVEYAMVIRPHELDADLTGAYIPVDPQEWTAENCPHSGQSGQADHFG